MSLSNYPPGVTGLEPEITGDGEPDLYETRDPTLAYATYTVFVDVGDAEDTFLEVCRSLGDAVETDWKDREWK